MDGEEAKFIIIVRGPTTVSLTFILIVFSHFVTLRLDFFTKKKVARQSRSFER